MVKEIPLVDLKSQYLGIKDEIDTAISSVLADASFIGGKYVKKFEADFAQTYGVKNVISCANGTDSLYIIMKMLNIGPGDEVITVANSWISSSESITQTGARPVFVDVDPVYYSIDERLIEEKLTANTKAVMAVHLQGQMCAVDSIKKICDKHKIFLIEDCAQSHFSELNGVRAGLTGIAGSFSFFPGKNLGAYGDAGCMITNDDAFAKKLRMYANHGALIKHHHMIEGVNSRLDALQAAVLLVKLPHVLEWTEKRIANAGLYNKYLSEIEGIESIMPKVRPNSKHSFHLYVIRAKERDELMRFLKERQIETAIHYPTPLPNLPAYQYLGHNVTDFPVATQLQGEILSLPMFPELTSAQIQYVAETIKEFYRPGQKSGMALKSEQAQ